MFPISNVPMDVSFASSDDVESRSRVRTVSSLSDSDFDSRSRSTSATSLMMLVLPVSHAAASIGVPGALTGAATGAVTSALAPGEGEVSSELRGKVSEAVTYGPRFVQVFNLFRSQCEVAAVDLSQHLLSLVLDHLVLFVRWLRQSEQHIVRVSRLLFNNEYLRPEVRNGAAVILIYAFAAAKSTRSPSSEDMFTVLGDAQQGFGIVNRLSLRIYCDPLQFFSFVKLTITALIDCGILPENERLNLPKAQSKSRHEDAEEYKAFITLKNRIVKDLQARARDGKKLVEKITSFWIEHKKKIPRGKQFSTVIAILPKSSSALDTLADVALKETREHASQQADLTRGVQSLSFASSAASASSRSIKKRVLGTPRSSVTAQIKTQRLRTLRFTRTGTLKWNVIEHAVFDVGEFFSMLRNDADVSNNLLLVNIDSAHPVTSPGVLLGSESSHAEDSTDITSSQDPAHAAHEEMNGRGPPSGGELEVELRRRGLLLATWDKHQPFSPQEISRSLNEEASASTPSQQNAHMFNRNNVLAFEVTQRCFIVLRRIPVSSPSPHCEDLACKIYPDDLNRCLDSPLTTFGTFLSDIFPILRETFPTATHTNVIVKYVAVKVTPKFSALSHSDLPHLPEQVPLQTIGCLSSNAFDLFSKLVSYTAFHNFVLEEIS